MATEVKRDKEQAPVGQDELRELSAELLRAIEAEPVPAPVLELARRLAQELALRAEAEPVPPPASRAGECD